MQQTTDHTDGVSAATAAAIAGACRAKESDPWPCGHVSGSFWRLIRASSSLSPSSTDAPGLLMICGACGCVLQLYVGENGGLIELREG
jgi:hypothetical protein